MKNILKRTVSVLLLLAMMAAMLTASAATVKGDMNGDGTVKLTDVRAILKIASGMKKPTSAQLSRGDMNGDGAITLSDVYAALDVCVNVDRREHLDPITQITPAESHGSSTKYTFCMVTEYCAETFPSSPVSDTSNPLYTPLPKGTFDYVTSGPVKDYESGKSFYILKSGRRVYANEVKTFTGYKMPNARAELRTRVDTDDTTTSFYIALDWRVPFNVKIKPQEYETGYNDRKYNISNGEFTGSYMDITFQYIKSADGTLAFPESKTIKSCKWIVNADNSTATLRIYFRNAGEFYGYHTYYNKDNYLVVTVKEPVQSLKGRTIEIDPGHGGNQPGAGSGTGVFEKDITYKIALRLKSYLESAGATVVFSRDDGASVPEIEERRINSMKKNADMFISIHLDSSSDKSAKGSSVYYYTSYSGELAEAIANNLPKSLKSNLDYTMKNRGFHFYPFRVTRIENCPAVLVECGFISNSSDFKIQNSASGQKYIAHGIYMGVLEYFGI